MTLSLYLTIQQIIMGAIMVLGCHLIFAEMPQQLKGGRIHVSGKMMGITAMIIPIASFIYYFSDLRNSEPQFATAINLTAYCLTTTFIALSYYILLDQTEHKTYIKAHLVIGLLYPFPLWIGLCYGSDYIAKHTLVASYTIFCVLAIIHISTCLYFYIQKLRNCNADNNITELQKRELKLLGQTIYASLGLIIVSLLSPSFFDYPLWLGVVFVSSFVVGVCYIYVCYHRIVSCNIDSLIKTEENAKKLGDIIEAKYIAENIEESVETETNTPILSDAVKANIEEYLTMWLKRKEYTRPEITINYVASAACTNRTYLSRYINSVYQCSFKTWITQLRIDEAKELMRTDADMPLAEVSKQAGFASIESFSHIFTRYEQLSPSKWRENNEINKESILNE